MNDYDFRNPDGKTSWRNDLVNESELVFLLLFTIECTIKTIGMGFVVGSGTYLRDTWNWLDFIVVFVGWIGLLPGVANLTALRAIRVLRPLRSVNAIREMRVLVSTLVNSIPYLVNVALFLLFVYIVFAIIGVTFLNGLYYQRCRYTEEPIGDDWPADPDNHNICGVGFDLYDCPSDRYCGLPGTHQLFDYKFIEEAQIEQFMWGIPSFDNLGVGLMTILEIITLEGWNNLMYNYYKAWNPVIISIYFIVVVIFGSFFLLSLLLAAIGSEYSKAQDRQMAKKATLMVDDLEETIRPPSAADARRIMPSHGQDDSRGAILGEEYESEQAYEEVANLNAGYVQAEIVADSDYAADYAGQAELGESLDVDPHYYTKKSTAVPPDTVKHASDKTSIKTFLNAESGKGSPESVASASALPDDDFSMDDFAETKFQAFRESVRVVVNSSSFTIFITICIVLNTILLATDRYPIDAQSSMAIEIGNMIFYSIFVFEMLIKFLGLGFVEYCRDRFNIFDAVIVLISTIEVAIFYSDSGGGGSAGAMSAFRGFRLLRAFKLARSWKEMRDLLEKMAATLAEISYFSVILFLFMFIFSLLGMELFAHRLKFDSDWEPDVDGESPRINFDDFWHAFITIYIVLVGDDWQYVHYDVVRSQGWAVSVIYFVALIIIGMFVLLNLFLAILLTKFEVEPDDEEAKDQKREKIESAHYSISMLKRRLTIERDELDEDEQGDEDYGKDRSLYIFPLNNKVRRFCANVIWWKYFDYIILVLIIVSSILLAIENPLNDPESDLQQNLAICDIIMTTLFVIEAVLKIVALGFIFNGKHSYMRNGWNILDFCIVVISVVSLGGTGGLSAFKALRTLRVLRPLRLISRAENLKTAIDALIASLPQVANTLLITVFFFLLFGIICVNYFKGTFFYCVTDHLPSELASLEIDTQQDCIDIGGAWMNQDSNFDNSANAILSLFVLTSTEGWAQIMFAGIDSVAIGKNPVYENNMSMAILFMIILFLGSLFILNILVGVVCGVFENQSTDLTLTTEQQQYIKHQLAIINRPLKVKPEIITNPLRKFCQKIAGNPKFDTFIMSWIILNTFVMAMNYYGMSQEMVNALDTLGLVFGIIYTLEAIIKIIAYKSKYFMDSWNRFDFTIVCISIFEFIITLFVEAGWLVINTLFRIFRIGRIVKLIKSAKKLNQIFTVVILTIPASFNLGCLLLLLIYIYTILGVQLFAKVKVQGGFNEFANFQEFWKAFMLLIRCSTGEAWNELMYAAAFTPTVLEQCIYNPTYEEIQANDGEPNGCGSWASYVYFITFTLIIAYVFLNLFIAVIYTNWLNAEKMQQSRLKDDFWDEFKEAWYLFDPEATGFIPLTDLRLFLNELNFPFGYKNASLDERKRLSKFIDDWPLQVFNDNTYHYSEVAHALSKFTFLEEQEEELDPDQLNLQRIESEQNTRLAASNKEMSEFKSDDVGKIIYIQDRIRFWVHKFRKRNAMKATPSNSDGAVKAPNINAKETSEDSEPMESIRPSTQAGPSDPTPARPTTMAGLTEETFREVKVEPIETSLSAEAPEVDAPPASALQSPETDNKPGATEQQGVTDQIYFGEGEEDVHSQRSSGEDD